MTTVTTQPRPHGRLHHADPDHPPYVVARVIEDLGLERRRRRLLAIGTMVSSSTINAVYDKAIAQDEDAILAKLADQSAQIVVFQVVASLTALALVVFAATPVSGRTSYESVAMATTSYDVPRSSTGHAAGRAGVLVGRHPRPMALPIRSAELIATDQAGVLSRTQLYAVGVTRVRSGPTSALADGGWWGRSASR